MRGDCFHVSSLIMRIGFLKQTSTKIFFLCLLVRFVFFLVSYPSLDFFLLVMGCVFVFGEEADSCLRASILANPCIRTLPPCRGHAFSFHSGLCTGALSSERPAFPHLAEAVRPHHWFCFEAVTTTGQYAVCLSVDCLTLLEL